MYHCLGTGYSVHNGTISAVERVAFISNRMSYVKRKGHWCDIVVLNVYASTNNKNYDSKGQTL